MDVRLASGADNLLNVLLNEQWLVVECIDRSVEHSGLAKASCYRATNGAGDNVFVKAYDFRHEDIGSDPEKLGELLEEYLHEKRVHTFCSNLSRVTRVVGEGRVTVDGTAVHYLLCEWAPDTFGKSYPPGDTAVSISERLRSLHKVAAGMAQLHGVGVAHQDIKPSNVVRCTEGTIKISDLGSSSCSHMKSPPHDSAPYCGQPNYAPYELLYNAPPGTWYRKRVGCDLFLLGNLIFTSFVGMSLTYIITHRLPVGMRHTQFAGEYDEVLPLLIQEQTFWIPYFLGALVDSSVADDLTRLVAQMCHPDPSKRGHPSNIAGKGGQYGLERYVSALDILARRAELEARRAELEKREAA